MRSAPTSVLGGSAVIAGTAIGAGMLALPMISAGMWLWWSLGLLAGTWLVMLRSSQAILELNSRFAPGRSFHTLIGSTLGPFWNALNGLTVAAVLYILVYAYVSGGGSVARETARLTLGLETGHALPALAFGLVLAAAVWAGARLVDRLSLIFIIAMALTFAASVSGMIGRVSPAILLGLEDAGQPDGRAVFVFSALSTYLTSFCFHASVPSLVKYLGRDWHSVNRCLVWGSLAALVWYAVWLIAADGVISRGRFAQIIAAGGNVGDLVAGANAALSGGFVVRLLEIFSFLAVVTSFLGAGLGLFDYVADLARFADTAAGRAKTALLTFAPPIACAILWPDGFLRAVGWAGLAAAVWSVIIPGLALASSRSRAKSRAPFAAPWGTALPVLLIAYGCLIGVCHILYMLHLLPEYP